MITKMEAICFLKCHQPMPNDDELKEEEIMKYEEIRKFFIDNPDEQCIPLFLNSFGGKDGLGVYQMVEDVILMYNDKTVFPYILDSFNSSYDSVKYWSIQIASNFPNSRLFTPLVNLLKHEDIDIKFAAISALAQLALNKIETNRIIELIKEERRRISDEEAAEFCEEVLLDIQDNITS